jgi:pyruvate/2-oxoglutarate dehydrogenase complex dihydrolipoamide acyltransferase (E2) component
MAISVQMPALGESVTEGTVTRWLKQEGDTVEQDEPLLEVSTDKVDTEIPSPAAGVLKKIIAQEDDTVEVGGELAVIGDGGEAPEEKSAARRRWSRRKLLLKNRTLIPNRPPRRPKNRRKRNQSRPQSCRPRRPW